MIILRHVYGETVDKFRAELRRAERELDAAGATDVRVSHTVGLAFSGWMCERLSAVITAEIPDSKPSPLGGRVTSETITP